LLSFAVVALSLLNPIKTYVFLTFSLFALCVFDFSTSEPPQDPQDRSKTPQDAPIPAQDRCKTAPRRPKTTPRLPQNRRKTTQDRSKTPQDVPRPPQDRPRTAPRWPKTPPDRPKPPQDRPKVSQIKKNEKNITPWCHGIMKGFAVYWYYGAMVLWYDATPGCVGITCTPPLCRIISHRILSCVIILPHTPSYPIMLPAYPSIPHHNPPNPIEPNWPWALALCPGPWPPGGAWALVALGPGP
jgi:hypothetical protein